ncbi:hypothetical protein [Chromobacterium haemolyticum]|uniref:hypothetical protein n=1 Tax=Chromobacterium haemolyticum TaxID=394935 RepID=UPI000594A252|nr:hypothetical protein [Chromobacterium haemolyticum]
MNTQLQEFARITLKNGLGKLPESNINMFKLMYGRANGERSVEDAKGMSIDDVISEIPADRLDWAMTQVQNSLDKLAASSMC